MEFSCSRCIRVFNVLEIQRSRIYASPPAPRENLVGSKYTIADIGAWSWVNGWRFSGITEEEMGKFPHLLNWVERIGKRSAAQKGVREKYGMEGAFVAGLLRHAQGFLEG
jgi:glutathione S-transferase